MLDPRTHHPTNSFELYDAAPHKPHTWEATNSSGLWPSKPAFEEVEVDDSGICSPPMWTTSPARRKNNLRSLSPTSRTQAIVSGQRELMEMVKNMPESNYELSLKDLVEHHRVVDATRQEKNVVEERKNLSSVYMKREKSRKVDNNNKMAQVKRNGNIDRGGFYLKMGLPFPFGSKDKKKKMKKKNESLGNSSSSRVTPKPSDGSAKGGGVVDKEWWKKSPLACKESDSGESSINSESGKSSGSSSSNSSSSRSNSRYVPTSFQPVEIKNAIFFSLYVLK